VWEKNNLTPIPFALAVLNILNIFILSPNVSRIDVVALRQQRSRISTITLTLIPSMTIDRPRRQCSRSSIRQSPWSVSTTFSMAIRSPGAVTSELTLILTIDRPCRQCSRSSICQLSWSIRVNPVNDWIQSNAASKIRMGLTSWPRRRARLGRSYSQLISWQPSQYIRIETNFNSKVFKRHQWPQQSAPAGCRNQTVKSTVSTYISHAHPAWTTGSDNLRYYNRSYGQNYNYGTVGLLR